MIVASKQSQTTPVKLEYLMTTAVIHPLVLSTHLKKSNFTCSMLQMCLRQLIRENNWLFSCYIHHCVHQLVAKVVLLSRYFTVGFGCSLKTASKTAR